MVVPTAEPSDETLAARAAAGDDRAFEEIVERYQGRVFRLACRLTSDTDPPDVLQEAFLQVYRHSDPGASLGGAGSAAGRERRGVSVGLTEVCPVRGDKVPLTRP